MLKMYCNFILLINLMFTLSAINCEVNVSTNSGPLKGSAAIFQNHTVYQFLGVPYAEPPVGDNRFAKPKPVGQWNATYDATSFKHSCPQDQVQSTPQSEDCLYLNIYTSAENINRTELLPVFFWIHGGGLQHGQGYSFNGSIIATYGVVFVSINYRLGPFGFIYGGEESAPGNVGIHDQILALKWVRENIKLFGGDASQITISGQSAGSWSVSALIVSPLSKGLFKRAVMQSGAYYFKHYHNSDKANHLAKAKSFSESLGCHTNTSDWLQCMRQINVTTIIAKNIIESSLTYGDDLLPNGIEEAMRLGKVNTDIELIAGVTNCEGTGSALNAFPKIRNTSTYVTKDEMKTVIMKKFNDNATYAQMVYDFFIGSANESDQIGLRQSFAKIYSDTFMICPTHYFAKHFAELIGVNKTLPHFYIVTYKSNRTNNTCSEEWMGVCHADDVPFISGSPIRSPKSWSENDYKFSVMVNEMWTNFIKYGNPLQRSIVNTMGVEVSDWPSFSKANESIVTQAMELNPNNLGRIHVEPYRHNCDEFWKPYFE